MIEHGWVAWVCSGFLWWPLRNLPQWMPNLALILFDPLRSELWNDWQSWLSMSALHGCAVVFCDDRFEIYHNECQIWHWFYLTHLDLNCEMIGNHDWTWVRCMVVQWFSVMTTSKFITMNARCCIACLIPKFRIFSFWMFLGYHGICMYLLHPWGIMIFVSFFLFSIFLFLNQIESKGTGNSSLLADVQTQPDDLPRTVGCNPLLRLSGRCAAYKSFNVQTGNDNGWHD